MEEVIKGKIWILFSFLFLLVGLGRLKALGDPGPTTNPIEQPASQYLKIESPEIVPIRIQKIRLATTASKAPDIHLEIVNHSKSSIIYLSFDLQEASTRGKELAFELEYGDKSSIWGGHSKRKTSLGPGRRLTLSIPGKFMKPYYSGGAQYGSKAVLYFGYLVCADGSGWEGHDDGTKWSAKKCRFHR